MPLSSCIAVRSAATEGDGSSDAEPTWDESIWDCRLWSRYDQLPEMRCLSSSEVACNYDTDIDNALLRTACRARLLAIETRPRSLAIEKRPSSLAITLAIETRLSSCQLQNKLYLSSHLHETFLVQHTHHSAWSDAKVKLSSALGTVDVAPFASRSHTRNKIDNL